MWEFISSAWTLAVVPSAIAIAGVCAFAKTLLEKRNLHLENQRLQLEISAAERRIILPSEDQIERYGVVRVAMRRTVRLSGILLAVLLPVSVALQTGPMPSGPPPPVNKPSPEVPPPPVNGPTVPEAQGRPPVNETRTHEAPRPPVNETPALAPPSIPDPELPTGSPGSGPPAPSALSAAAHLKKTLAEYEQAAEALDYERVKRVWPTAPDALRNSYRNLRSLSVDLDCAEPAITSVTATISCKEQIRSVGAGGTALPVATNTAMFSLLRNGDAWEIARISRQPR